MQDKDYISETFLRNQHKLNEKPPAELWQRLEDRLDRRKKPRFTLTQYLAAASVIFALASSVVLLNHVQKNNNNNPVAQQETKRQEPIAAKEELQKPNAPGTLPAPPPPPVMNQGPIDRIIAFSPPSVATDEVADVQTNPVVFDVASGAATAGIEADSVMTTPAVAMVEPDQPVAINTEMSRAEDVYAFKQAERFDAEEADEYKSPSLANMTPASEPARKNAKDKAPAMDDVAVRERARGAEAKSKKVSGKKERSKEVALNIQKLSWLLGTWEDDNFEGHSYETWVMKDGNTLEGRGVLVVNNDTIFSERISIQQEGDETYYVAAVDNFNRRLKFRLVAINGDRFTFEQYGEGFPTRIVLEQRNDGSVSTEVFSQKGGYLNDQMAYLSKRNFVSADRAVRYLARPGAPPRNYPNRAMEQAPMKNVKKKE